MKKLALAILGLVLVSGCSSGGDSNKNQQDSGNPKKMSEKLPDFDAKIASSWKLTSRTSEEANSNDEFLVFKDKHSKYFKYMKDTEVPLVFFAEVVVSNYVFTQAHTCAPNDPRLVFVNEFFSYCKKTDEGYTCLAPISFAPKMTDPCSN